MKTLKLLLLQMKLDPNYEMRILAEEEIINLFENEKQKAQKLVEALRFYSHDTERKIQITPFGYGTDRGEVAEKALAAYSTDSGDGEKL